MRAIAVRKFRDAPEIMDLPRPVPSAGELLVHVGAASINPFDWKILDGMLDGSMPHVFPLVLGVDAAGVVEAVGPGVTRFRVGDGVYGQFLHAPVGTGTFCDYTTVPETNGIAPIPRGIYTAQAASVPTAGMTARQALDELGLAKNQTLLILGAAGGVGSFATQLAAMAGIHVIVGSRGANRDYLRKLGATEFFDTSTGHLLEELKYAHPGGVDAILDLMNKRPAFEANLTALREGGIVASTVTHPEPAVMAEKKVRGTYIQMHPSSEILERLSKELAAGRLRTPIELQVPFADALNAFETLRTGQGRGKAVFLL
jgi:NADPH:quinone reductase-like Zn-dependent oxidoreductase